MSDENSNIQVEITDPHEFHCFRLVLNPQGFRLVLNPESEMTERCEVHGRMRGDCGCPPRIEIMLDARSLVDLIHKCSLALCDWQAQNTAELIEKLTRYAEVSRGTSQD